MNYKLIPGLLTLLILLMPMACTERVELDLDTTYTRLVVEGYVSSDSVAHRVRLSTTADYYSNQTTPRVTQAQVEISYNDQTILLPESVDSPGLYICEKAFRGEPGVIYNLNIQQVDIDGDGQEENYQAESSMESGAYLSQISLKYFPTPILNAYLISMSGFHRKYERDWFGFKVWRNSDLLTDTLNKYTTFNDDLFDDGGFNGFPIAYLDDSDPRQALEPGDTVTLQMEHLSEFYYLFINDIMLEGVGNYPLFTGPSANVRTNISNGALGIFAAYSISRASVIVGEK